MESQGDSVRRALRWAEWCGGVTAVLFTVLGNPMEWGGVVLILCSGVAFVGMCRALRSRIDAKAIAERSNQMLVDALREALRVEQCLVEDLKEARAEAEQVARFKDEFLANMSHEIRTPMTAILGFSEALLDPTSSDLERLEASRTIHRNGRHLLTLVNDILDLSKIEAGRLEIERTICYPRRILRDVRDLLGPRADRKNLTLAVELATPIPEYIQSDPVRIRQALVNLTSNAVKFTECGTVRVVAQSDPARETLTFRVIDEGIGLSSEQISRLFQPFVQADAATARKHGGTGLGLAITKRLAELLGGGVTVESEPGKGSVFVMTISTGPLDGVEMIDRIEDRHMSVGSSEDRDPLPALVGRVLLVEDSCDIQRLIALVLRKAGAEVTVVENGKLGVDAALAARADECPFDVILMDMQMPVMDGYTAARALRENEYEGQIIALTARAMKGECEECLAAGCDHYLSKPIDRKLLVREIAARLGRVSTNTPSSCCLQ